MKKIVFSGIILLAFLCCLVLAPQVLASTPKTITGHVVDSDGANVTNAMIVPTRVDSGDMTGIISGNTDGSGNFSLALPAADWSLTVRPTSYASTWAYYGSPVIVVFNHNESIESKTQDFTVTKTDATITGILLYSTGSPATGAQVSAVNGEGKGTTVQAGAGGSFSIPVLGDVYSVEVGWHPEMSTQAFSRQNVTVSSGATQSVGTITASLMDAHISGTVTGVSEGFGSGMTIRCWQKDGNVTLNTDTNSNKQFDFAVAPGTWLLGPGGGGQSHHHFMRSPIEVVVSDHGQIVNVDFPFVTGDYFVSGSITDEDGNAVNLTDGGTVYVRDEKGQTFTNFIEGNSYQIIYPSSYMTENITVGLKVLPNFTVGGVSYSFKEEKNLAMTTDHGTANLVLKRDEETISGNILNMNGSAYSSLPTAIRVVAADGNGNVKTADVNSNGTYTLTLADGTWKVSYKILQEGTNYYIAGASDVVVSDNANVSLNLTLGQVDSTITGQVLDKDENIVANTSVIATSGTLNFKTKTDSSGNYSLGVRSGFFYNMTMGVPATLSGNLPAIVSTSANGIATLRMQAANATISGKVYKGGSVVSSGYVRAWTTSGAFAQSDIGSDGSYSLGVTSGATWSVAAVYNSETKVYVSAVEELSTGTTNSLNINLGEDYYNFPPVTIEKFYASESRVMTLKDGTVIQLPANATGSGNGQRTLMAIPTINVASQTNSLTLPIGYDLEIRDENNIKISNLYQPITMIFAWNQNMTDEMGADIDTLTTKYWDNNNSIWQGMGLDIKNTTNNTDVIVTDHLTSFGLATTSFGEVVKSNHYIVNLPRKGMAAFVKLYKYTGKKYSKFYAFKKKLKSGFKSASGDFNGDIVDELVVFSDNTLKNIGLMMLTKNGTKLLKKNFYPFGKNYDKNFEIYGYDFNVDGKQELVVSGKTINVYKLKGKKLKLYKSLKPVKNVNNFKSVMADIISKYAGKELITWSANYPKVSIYRFTKKNKFKLIKTKKFVPCGDQFDMEYGKIKAGNFKGSNLDELVVTCYDFSAKIYNFKKNKFKLLAKKSLIANDFDGVNLQIGDVNANGKDEMVLTSENGKKDIFVYRLNGKKIKLLKKFGTGYKNAVNLTVGDLNRDGKAEIVAVEKDGKYVKVFKYAKKKFKMLKRFAPYGKKYVDGLNVSLLKY